VKELEKLSAVVVSGTRGAEAALEQKLIDYA
jgi:hypothetical protein